MKMQRGMFSDVLYDNEFFTKTIIDMEIERIIKNQKYHGNAIIYWDLVDWAAGVFFNCPQYQ
jgi:hypothetical protein